MHHTGPDPQRGWSRKAAKTTSEYLNGGTRDDLRDEKEHFDCGPRDDTECPNLRPDEDLPEYRIFIEEYFEVCQKPCLEILEVLEVSLRLPRGALVEHYTRAASELCVLHYKPVSIKTLLEWRYKRT